MIRASLFIKKVCDRTATMTNESSARTIRPYGKLGSHYEATTMGVFWLNTARVGGWIAAGLSLLYMWSHYYNIIDFVLLIVIEVSIVGSFQILSAKCSTKMPSGTTE
jgi:hypothetical protein